MLKDELLTREQLMEYLKISRTTLKKLMKQKRRDDARMIKEINAEAYLGDGSTASRRIYLLEQAYKRAREATPVVSMAATRVADEYLVDAINDADRLEDIAINDLVDSLHEIEDENGNENEHENAPAEENVLFSE